jgi:hypothetical protein
MNERIRQLEKQSTEIVQCGLNGTSTAESFNRKKFAELIVRECAQVASDYDGAHYVGTAIEKHFGVEE